MVPSCLQYEIDFQIKIKSKYDDFLRLSTRAMEWCNRQKIKNFYEKKRNMVKPA